MNIDHPTLPTMPLSEANRRLAADMHTYVNYSEISEDAAAKGGVMKENQSFYGDRVLSLLAKKLAGLSEDKIHQVVDQLDEIIEIIQ